MRETNSDETETLVLRRTLIVLAGLALILGTGILAVGWLGVWDNTSSHLVGPTGQRALGVLFFWPMTGLVVWVLGGAALLARQRFTAAGVYTLAVFAAIVAIPAIVVVLPVAVPSLAPLGLVTAPGWIGALFFLALDAAVIYVAWTKLFAGDFINQLPSGRLWTSIAGVWALQQTSRVLMRLMGHANWWTPAFLRALYRRVGLGEFGQMRANEVA